MILIDDNHDGNYGFHDVNRKHCTLSYDHGKTREELLSFGNQALQRENFIDVSMELLREEFEHADHYGAIYDLEEFAWETEFHNCVERYEETFNKKEGIDETDIEVLRLWKEFVEQWADNNEAYVSIDSGGSLGFMEQSYHPENTFKEELIKGLQDALQRGDVAGYAADIAADYKQMLEEEIRQHIQRDDSQILASYYYGVMGEYGTALPAYGRTSDY